MESFITLSAIGLMAGVLFSIPIWGPVSIFIATNGLRGRWRYCITVALGSGIVDSMVCFIVILGFAKIIGIISPLLPYLFLCGGVVLFFTGMRIILTKIDLYQDGATEKRTLIKNMRGFWAGFFLNASNPSILFGWLTSSFLSISFAASLGFNVGWFDRSIGASMQTLKNFSVHNQSPKDKMQNTDAFKGPPISPAPSGKKEISAPPQFLAGAGFAFSVGIGTVLWYSSFSYFLSRYRARFRLVILKRAIQGLGGLLCVLALYFLSRASITFILPLISS